MGEFWYNEHADIKFDFLALLFSRKVTFVFLKN